MPRDIFCQPFVVPQGLPILISFLHGRLGVDTAVVCCYLRANFLWSLLMKFPDFDPVFLRIGPLQFRWYGLMYIIGFIAAYFIIKAGAKKKHLPLSKDDVADLIFTVALGVILGGRLGYILFYDLQVYLAKPLEIFAVWHGGMSFHGGLLGAIAAGFYYIRKKGIGFYQIATSAS